MSLKILTRSVVTSAGSYQRPPAWTYRKDRDVESKDMHVYQYVNPGSRPQTKLFGWGLCASGALGIPVKLLLIKDFIELQQFRSLWMVKITADQSERYLLLVACL